MGDNVIGPEVVRNLLSRSRPGLFSALTAREREVLGLTADVQSNADSAQTLTFAEETMSKHIGSIFVKLGASPVAENRRVEAVFTCLQNPE